jgi:hypothetical protein
MSDWAPVHYSNFSTWLKINSFLKAREVHPEEKDKCHLLPHQQFVRRFFGNPSSPYRGILLYHDMGTGKTITSISAAEALKSKQDIVVFLKASLEENFLKEIVKCGKLPPNKYTFLHYNGLNINTIRKLGGPSFFDNKVIIIDEVHNFISYVKNGKRVKSFLYDILLNAKNIKLICLSGTPLQNDVGELAILANLLRGSIKEHVFQGKIEKVSNLNQFLDEHPHIDEFKLESVINKLKVVLTPSGFKKDKNKQVLVKSDITDDKVIDEIKSFFVRTNNNNRKQIAFTYQIQTNTLFSRDINDFNDMFVDKEKETIKNEKLLERKLQGLISFYKNEAQDLFPDMSKPIIVKVAMSPLAFEKYKIIRDNERIQERRNLQKMFINSSDDSKQNQTYKAYSRALGLFTFPEEIPKVYPSNLSDTSESLHIEREKMMKKLEMNADKYLTGKGLKTYGPKYSAFLQMLKKSPGPAMAYSYLTEIEGLGIMQLVLRANGYSKFENIANKSEKYAILTSDKGKNDIILNVFNHEDNKYGDIIRVLLISQKGAEGMSLRNVRQVHIMEPYWNQVRNKQVIGRASRMDSHSTLPPEERNVKVFIYISVLGNQELREDKNMTSDEVILNIAERKGRLIGQMQDIMKKSALDCPLYRQDCSEVNDNNRLIYDLIKKKEN